MLAWIICLDGPINENKKIDAAAQMVLCAVFHFYWIFLKQNTGHNGIDTKDNG